VLTRRAARAASGAAAIALADPPLAAVDRLARTSLPLSSAASRERVAQRAAVFADDPDTSSAALEELLELFVRPEERRRSPSGWREAAEHLRVARTKFVESLEPGTTNAAVAGLQDLLLRGGAVREAADLGWVALALPELADPMPVLARTAAALVDLGRLPAARALILDLRTRNAKGLDPEGAAEPGLRDELLEWCQLLERLGLWDDLRGAAWELIQRNTDDPERAQLGLFLAATCDLRQNQLAAATSKLDSLGANPAPAHDVPVRAWLARAEIARKQHQRAQERYALLSATKTAALDPDEPLRSELGRAWKRLSDMQSEEGDQGSAEISLTHALRLSSAHASELWPLWEELGARVSPRHAPAVPYQLYARARDQEASGLSGPALDDARTLLKSYPGLGPALEVAARAAGKQRDYPQLISSSLEMLERGWPGVAPSARLRSVPKEFFLPQDRVRWLLLDPRGSLEDVVRRLLAKGDVQGAALGRRAAVRRASSRRSSCRSWPRSS
jgi:tetratricopeptide (TPR) repeat protein